MYEKPINGEHEIVKKNLYLCTTFFKVRRNNGCNRYKFPGSIFLYALQEKNVNCIFDDV